MNNPVHIAVAIPTGLLHGRRALPAKPLPYLPINPQARYAFVCSGRSSGSFRPVRVFSELCSNDNAGGQIQELTAAGTAPDSHRIPFPLRRKITHFPRNRQAKSKKF